MSFQFQRYEIIFIMLYVLMNDWFVDFIFNHSLILAFILFTVIQNLLHLQYEPHYYFIPSDFFYCSYVWPGNRNGKVYAGFQRPHE